MLEQDQYNAPSIIEIIASALSNGFEVLLILLNER